MNVRSRQNAVFQDETPNYRDERNYSIFEFKSKWKAVRVPSQISVWNSVLEARFNELTSLSVGWDGYKGQPVSFSCARFSAGLIESLCIPSVSAPQIVPGSDGSLQMEWHENQFDIEIDVLEPYKVIATRFDLVSEKEEEIELEADFTRLFEWISELAQDRTI